LDLDPGQLVAQRFRILRPLGRGGMGEVFAAENLRTGRQVAIKLLRSESKMKSSAIERFRREARAAGSIQSDFVTQILDVDEDPEHGIVLVFELLEGESLVERLKRTGPIPFDELHPMIEQVWMGLADAHRAGIIHRDLKPSNVFLERRPNGGVRVKLLDFGISKLPREMGGETLTELGQSLGTFSFMPPEQIGKAKTVDHRADVYACASLIYQALSGQLPYAAKNILMMVELKTKQEPRRLSQAMDGPVDPRLDEFLAIALARDPENRFQSADDALAAWRALAGTSSGRAVTAGGGRADAVPSPFVSQGHGQHASMHGHAGVLASHGQGAPASHAGLHASHGGAPSGYGLERPPTPAYGAAARAPVSVPRVNTSTDSWDDSAPPSESGHGEDVATVAIRRDQVGQALQQYGLPRVDLTRDDDVRTSQGTVMMITNPRATGGSMHRSRGGGAAGGHALGGPMPGGGPGGGMHGGMMSPALMPPLQPPGLGGDPRASQHGIPVGDLSQRITPPEAKRGGAKLVVVGVVLAVMSFALIVALLQLVGQR
jgi:serine/threonine-protein kinase